VAGKIGTFLLWVLFLVLQTATKIVGSLLAPPGEQQEEDQQQEAAARRRSPPASPHRDLFEQASAPPPPPHLWDPPQPPAYPASAPAADEYASSSSFRRRATAPARSLVEDVAASSNTYSRHAYSVSAPPQRAVEVRSVPARAAAGGKRPRLERKYSKIVDQYRSLDEVCVCVVHCYVNCRFLRVMF
jgi:E3 ubiquitin-protein ligase RGLG